MYELANSFGKIVTQIRCSLIPVEDGSDGAVSSSGSLGSGSTVSSPSRSESTFGGSLASTGGLTGESARRQCVRMRAAVDLRRAGQFFPAVRGVAPGAAELEVNQHRHFELHRLAAEPRHHLGLLPRRDRAFQASCTCSRGTIPSRQQASIQFLVWIAAEPWISAFSAL